MSTANASDSDSNINSKIPSKFISDDVVQDDHAPLWCYVSILDKNSEGGGNKSWSCNFCQKVFRSSYSRVKAHLLRIYGTGISVCASVNDQYLVELKSIKISRNEVAYAECNWITQVVDDVSFVRNFIMNHSMRLAIFNHFSPLKLLAIAETRFASILVMLKRFKLLKGALQSMVISEEWNSYREDDVGKAQAAKEFILNDVWWDKITYILNFTEPIYSMLRACDTDSPTLHLVYEMWDSMIEKVKTSIYRYEGKELNDTSTFYEVVYSILIDRWTKSCTPLHCMAHSLNPRYYSDEWLQEAPNRISPHEDEEISMERNKYRWTLDAKSWWVMHGSSAPLLQKLSLKLLVQPSSSSCCERNWSTYSFIHSLKRNKLNPKRAEDLVYVHTNLRLLSRKSEEYMQGSTRMWDIGGDAWGSFDGVENLEVASLSLDEPEMEAVLFTDDGQGGDEIDTIPISRQ
uniref:BED-type domain-containing protein n=1 Tax=Cajanus cajan TaxID=3821 RepID=A0A151UG35_CAJCA